MIIIEEGDDSSDEEDAAAIEEAALEAADDSTVDSGQEAHDNAVVKTLRGQAIKIMQDAGVVMDYQEEKMALQLFPRVRNILPASITY